MDTFVRKETACGCSRDGTGEFVSKESQEEETTCVFALLLPPLKF